MPMLDVESIVKFGFTFEVFLVGIDATAALSISDNSNGISKFDPKSFWTQITFGAVETRDTI